MSARIHRLSDVLRVALLGAGLLAAAASSGSGQTSSYTVPTSGQFASPAPRAMQPDRAIGLWQTSFGPVKIEADPGASGSDGVQGAWRYTQGRREVIGVFWGTLRGNVLDFSWHEPGVGGDLRGQGYLVFDPSGDRFSGKWWTTRRDKYGDWTGSRPAGADQPPAEAADDGAQPAGQPTSPPPPPPY